MGVLRQICASDNLIHYNKVIDEIENTFILISTQMFCEDNNLCDYISTIKQYNIYESIDKLFCEIVMQIPKSDMTHNMSIIISKFPKSLIPCITNDVVFDLCPTCGIKMSIDSAKISYYCENCGIIREVLDNIMYEAPIFGSVLIKPIATNKQNIHFRKWWQKILGLESDTKLGDKSPGNRNGEVTLQKIRRSLKNDKYKINRLTVNIIRTVLSNLGFSGLYDHTTLLLIKLTSVGPPIPDEEFTEKVEMIFSKVLEILELIKDSTVSVHKYYPYYIMKIIDALLPEKDAYRKILFYIYVQKKETIEKSDLEWQRICPHLEGVKYKPTVRDFTLQYY